MAIRLDWAQQAATEIMQPHWKETRTMDYWEELNREANIIRKYGFAEYSMTSINKNPNK